MRRRPGCPGGEALFLSCLRFGKRRGAKGRRCRGRVSNFPKSRDQPGQQRAGEPGRPKRVREEMLAAHLLYPAQKESCANAADVGEGRLAREWVARRPPARKATWPTGVAGRETMSGIPAFGHPVEETKQSWLPP